jgi:cell division protein FtsL
MVAKQQEEWIIITQPEPVEEPVIPFPTRPDAGLRRKCFYLFILILTISMIIVAQNERLAQTGYELVKMKEYAAELEKDNQTLRIDIAKLKSPERIGNIATHQLGLVLPGTENITENAAENI